LATLNTEAKRNDNTQNVSGSEMAMSLAEADALLARTGYREQIDAELVEA
jgi:hypothetical protein